MGSSPEAASPEVASLEIMPLLGRVALLQLLLHHQPSEEVLRKIGETSTFHPSPMTKIGEKLRLLRGETVVEGVVVIKTMIVRERKKMMMISGIVVVDTAAATAAGIRKEKAKKEREIKDKIRKEAIIMEESAGRKTKVEAAETGARKASRVGPHRR